MKKTRLIYDYMTTCEKKKALELLKLNRKDLKKEISRGEDSYAPIVWQILNDTLDKWNLEIDELEEEIKENAWKLSCIFRMYRNVKLSLHSTSSLYV